MQGWRLADFPDHLIKAVLATEDRRFYEDGEVPHSFGNAEFEQVHAQDFVDAARVELGGSADGVEVDCAGFFERG